MSPTSTTPEPAPGTGTGPVLPAPATRPPVDLRPLLAADPMSQGPRPVCVPMAVSVSHEVARSGAGSPLDTLAPESIWWYCSERGQTGPQGMLLTDAAEALTKVGQPPIETWPFNADLGVSTEQPPVTTAEPPWHTGILSPLHLAHDGVEDALEDALAAGSAVLLVLEVADEFLEPDDGGHVAVPDPASAPGDYHAVVCVGAATHPKYGRRLLIRNSWGVYWGLGGYCWLPLEYLVAFAPQAAIIHPIQSN